MIDKLQLHSQQYAEDYGSWAKYYEYMLICSYVTRLSKQCLRYHRAFPFYINFQTFATDKYVLTEESNGATIGRNVADTHFVQDTYYNIARYILNHPDEFNQEFAEYLTKSAKSVPKAFAMQFLIGALEATTPGEFVRCLENMRIIPWDASMDNNNVSRWNGDDNPNWKPTSEKEIPFKAFGIMNSDFIYE